MPSAPPLALTHRDPDRFVPRIERRAGLPWPVSTLVLWQDRARMRAQLAMLEAHMLRDMGIRDDQVRFEASKPFWRG